VLGMCRKRFVIVADAVTDTDAVIGLCATTVTSVRFTLFH
jgi:hypothetical protein